MPTPDYLAIGHVSRDLVPDGPRLGGSVVYAALTARALGLRPAVVTAHDDRCNLGELAELPRVCVASEETTTFALQETAEGRRLHLLARAALLEHTHVPEAWRRPGIVHIAPIADETPPETIAAFSGRFVGVTPQGWLRAWGEDGVVQPVWKPHLADALAKADAVVLSSEDLGGDERRVAELAARLPVLVVTRGAEGASLYWRGEVRHFPAAPVHVDETTGAGDIFAAAFFIRLYHTGDPREAARFAVALASASAQRAGLASVPTPADVRHALRS